MKLGNKTSRNYTDSLIENSMKTQKLADKIIKIMQDAGLSPEDMLKVIKLAREKLEQMENKKLKKTCGVKGLNACRFHIPKGNLCDTIYYCKEQVD